VLWASKRRFSKGMKTATAVFMKRSRVSIKRIVAIVACLGVIGCGLVLLSFSRERQSRLDAEFVHALQYGEADKALACLRKGASVNARYVVKEPASNFWEKITDLFKGHNEGSTALMLASGQGMRAMVQELIEKGADVNAHDSDGGTALTYASIEDVVIVQWLLDHGAEIDPRDVVGWTPLFYAVVHGRTDIVPVLLERGADPTLRDKDGNSVLARARQYGSPQEVLTLLKRYGAPP
jgi:hypothetical protein